MAELGLQARIEGDRLVVSGDAGPVLSAKWIRNRYHWHERVFRLVFTQHVQMSTAEIMASVRLLAVMLRQVLIEGQRPLLFRVTLSLESGLVPALRAAGFLVARHVFEPVLDPQVAAGSSVDIPDGTELIDLAAARDQFGDEVLTSLYLDVYARCSRLDPFTPERVAADDLAGFLFGDGDLVEELSCCAVLEGVPVGLVPVFQGAGRHQFEFGPFGVSNRQLDRHEQLSGGMLNWVFRNSIHSPWFAESFIAEVDSDDPYILYACAALPFRTAAESVSLFLAPNWES